MTIERNQRITAIAKVTGPVVVLMTALAFGLWQMERISGAAALLIIGASPVAGIGLGAVIFGVVSVTASKVGNLISANHDLPPAPSFSQMESLVARGRPDLALQAYQEHLAANPVDLEAHLAVAALWRDQLGDPERAIQGFLAARRLAPDSDREFLISNALIDLYRSTGQSGRELGELARLADRFGDTRAGQAAREAVRRRKAAER